MQWGLHLPIREFVALNKLHNQTMHRSGRSAPLDFSDFFGGYSVMVAVLRMNHWYFEIAWDD